MKKMIFSGLLLTTLGAFAGNGSGTMASVAESFELASKNIIYSYGEKDGVIRFAHGQLKGQEWTIQKVQVRDLEALANPQLTEALIRSEQIQNWAIVGDQ